MIANVEQKRQELAEKGFTRIEAFHSLAELAPLKTAIARIIGKLCQQHLGKPIPIKDFNAPELQTAFLELVQHDRKLGGIVYDAVKQIPEFCRLTASEKNIALACALRNSDFMGITRGGDGIRIDSPTETTFMAPWHQDYLSQFSSIDGLVFWSPLVDITPDIGPLEICVGSHRNGPRPIYYSDAAFAGSAYGMQLADEERVISSYKHEHLLCNAGDLLVIDFLTLHRSGFNRSPFARWSMQLRYFNFNNEAAMACGWPSGFSQGNKLDMIHPELIVERP